MRERQVQERVVVTGMGAVTPLGLSVDETWRALLAGRSGIAPITLFDASELPIRIGGEVKGFDPADYVDFKEARRMARTSHLALAAAAQAMADAGLGDEVPDGERAGVVMGTSLGGLDVAFEAWDTFRNRGLRRVSPFQATALLANMPAHHLSLRYQCQSYNGTVVTACAAGTQAIGEAAEVIRRGAADVMLAGGVEAMIHPFLLSSFIVMRVLAGDNDHPQQAVKPFDARRDGFATAEGTAVVVLERLDHALDRGAPIQAEVLGFAANTDAYHVAVPEPDGRGAAQCISLALENAGLSPAEVDYINAHGPGTVAGDLAETKAIKAIFGSRAYDTPVSSTKSMLGHAIGGAGAIEAVVCARTIAEGIIHPTINYQEPDPDCDLDYVPGAARPATVRATLSNSFGLGGQNACLVLGRYEG